MKNNTNIKNKWAYLPLVFSSTAILTTQIVTAGPSQQYPQYEDARQVGSANYNYVGGRTQVGGNITDDGDMSIDANHIFSETDNSASSVGLWGGIDLDDGEVQDGGAQLNHNWVSRDKSGRATHVNKAFVAYDRNREDHDKATAGYGQEYENLFWEGHVSKGLSGKKKTLTQHNGRDVSTKAYDWGVGGSVGTFIESANMRVRAGVDHEWGDDVAAAFGTQAAEDNATNTTLSAGIEKFFKGTGHSISLDVAASKKDGGTKLPGFDDTDLTANLGYHYDFGGDVYQPDRKYRRVRMEVPGVSRPARYERQPINKRVATYKNVPTYGTKTVKKPYKQLVKTSMALEGQTFFKLNSAKLIPSAQKRLKQIANEIRKQGYRGAIRITGNTCGLGNAKYDQRLSEQRAKAVRSFLVKEGFKADTLVARGLGKGHPKYPNTPAQGFKNRRVDIEYVTEYKSYKTAYRTEQQKVQTGTRRVATGFKNVPAGYKNVLIDSGAPGAPRVIWKTEVIQSSPAWIKRALRNNIKHNRSVNTYFTTAGSPVGIAPVVNVAPVANPDYAETACTTPVTIDVVNNDTDADLNDILTVTSFTQPAHGNVVQNTAGQLIYTPNADACGLTDTFAYTVSDGTDTADSTVTINVAGEVIIDPTDPTDPTDDSGNDDHSHDDGTDDGHSHDDDSDDHSHDDDSDDDHSHDDDSDDNDSGSDNDHVNSAPVAANDSASTDMNQAVTITVLRNDRDNDNDVLSIKSFTQGSNGRVSQDVWGKLTYTPNAGFYGRDSFSYTILDGNGGFDTATVSVSIAKVEDNTATNVAPVAVNDQANTESGQAVSVNVLSNDSDDDGDSLAIKGFTQPANGSVIIANGKMLYKSDDKFMGTDTFTYTISDGNGHTSTATVTINVGTGCNVECPEESTDPTNGTKATVDNAATNAGESVSIMVLANDAGTGLSIGDVDSPSNGTAVKVGSSIKYTPSTGFVGTDSFWYEVIDAKGYKDSAEVTVVVSANDGDENDDNGDGDGRNDTTPVANNDTASTIENTAISIDVLANDTAGLTIASVTATANSYAEVINGQISYVPNNGFTGTDTVSYSVQNADGQTATATVTISVTANVVTPPTPPSVPNRAPDAVEDAPGTDKDTAITVDVVANDIDPDGDVLTITNVTQPQSGSARIVNNKIVYTPNGTVGSMSMIYTISDGHGHTDQTVLTISVTDPTDGNNSAPVIKSENVTVRIGESILIDVLANDTDDDGDTLVLDQVDSGGQGITEKVNGKVRYTPILGTSGTDTFFYGVHDNHGHNGSGTVTVTIIQ